MDTAEDGASSAPASAAAAAAIAGGSEWKLKTEPSFASASALDLGLVPSQAESDGTALGDSKQQQPGFQHAPPVKGGVWPQQWRAPMLPLTDKNPSPVRLDPRD
jgi:hypothetical protein